MVGKPKIGLMTDKFDPASVIIMIGEDTPFIFKIHEDEILRITPAGFYIRGEKVEEDSEEAQRVYSAFRGWLISASLIRNY